MPFTGIQPNGPPTAPVFTQSRYERRGRRPPLALLLVGTFAVVLACARALLVGFRWLARRIPGRDIPRAHRD